MPNQPNIGSLVAEITLIDGRIIPLPDIRLNSDGWNFSRVSSGERLTYQIKQRDKVQYFPSYDVAYANDKIYQDLRGESSGPLPTNVTRILAEQLVTDPLGAPAEAAGAFADKLKEVANSPKTWLIAGGVVAVIVVALVVFYVPKPRTS